MISDVDWGPDWVIASVALIIASIAWLIVSFCLVNGLVERGNALKLVYCAVFLNRYASLA
ncbi:hypothetical protein RYX45_18230 [Alkalihalophilus pseudofirmus]|uniref:Uncharacterized protein n=1 Tax=Alkalihalophilus pseudofirmus TaxID=79885 RepID=A0AAJ2U4I1_ALKPS|nr:hypothetical protein [Alkalihalophilus pseudofirmus]MDV2887127.1 hypothetical protein [Alkalihalophilus pseudofirmus]